MHINTLSAVYNNILQSELFRIDGKPINLAAHVLAIVQGIKDQPADDDAWMYIGEFSECSLSDFIVGAYWASQGWTDGSWQGEANNIYNALSEVFKPGMSNLDCDNSGESIAYEVVDRYLEKLNNRVLNCSE